MMKFIVYILVVLGYITSTNAQSFDEKQADAVIRNGTVQELRDLIQSGYDIDHIYQCQTLLTTAIKSAAENPIVKTSPRNALTKIKVLLEAGANYNREPCPGQSLHPIFLTVSLPLLLLQTENELNDILDNNIAKASEYCEIGNLVSKPCKDITKEEREQLRLYFHQTTQLALKNLTPYFTKILKLLLSRHVDLAQTDENKNSILHYAAAMPPEIKTEALNLLLKTGIFVDPQNNDGQTPLFFAYGAENPEAIEALSNAGTDLTMRDNNEMLAHQTKFVIIRPNARADGSFAISVQN